jgi:hypothetical protein
VSDLVLFSYSFDGSGGGAALPDVAISCLLRDASLLGASECRPS